MTDFHDQAGREAYYRSLVARWKKDKVGGFDGTLKAVRGEYLEEAEFHVLDDLVALSRDFLRCIMSFSSGESDVPSTLETLGALAEREKQLRESIGAGREINRQKIDLGREEERSDDVAKGRFAFYDWLTSQIQVLQGDIPFCQSEILKNGRLDEADLKNIAAGLQANIALV